MGICLSQCISGIDQVYDPAKDNVKTHPLDKTSDFSENNTNFLPRNASRLNYDPDAICRICFSDNVDNLENFCDCKGSIKYMHRECLIKWMEASRNNICRVCNKEFNIYKKVDRQPTSPRDIEPPPLLDSDLLSMSRQSRRVFNMELRNRNVQNVIERLGYNPIMNLPGSV